MAALSDDDIRCLFLKGVLFGYELYGKIGKRPISDIDIYVSFEQISKAMDYTTSIRLYD